MYWKYCIVRRVKIKFDKLQGDQLMSTTIELYHWIIKSFWTDLGQTNPYCKCNINIFDDLVTTMKLKYYQSYQSTVFVSTLRIWSVSCSYKCHLQYYLWDKILFMMTNVPTCQKYSLKNLIIFDYLVKINYINVPFQFHFSSLRKLH